MISTNSSKFGKHNNNKFGNVNVNMNMNKMNINHQSCECYKEIKILFHLMIV